MLFIPGTFLSLLCMEKLGLRSTLLIGAFLTMMASIMRYGSVFLTSQSDGKGGYYLLLLGTCLAALVQPFFLNTSANLAGDWFPVSERDLTSTVGTMFSPIGNAVGEVLPPFFVYTRNETSNTNDDNLSGHEIERYSVFNTKS